MTIIEKTGVINGENTLEASCYKTKEEALDAIKTMGKGFNDAGFGTEISKDHENAIHVWDDENTDFTVSMYETEPYDLAPYIVSHSYVYPEEDGVYLEVLHDYMNMELSVFVYIPEYPEIKDNVLTLSLEEGDISDQTALAMISLDLPEIISEILEECQMDDEDQ